MKKILVIFGGVVQEFETEFWQALEDALGAKLSFGCSRWEEYESNLSAWVRERLVFEHVESQKVVGQLYKKKAGSIIRHTGGVRPFNIMMMWHKWRELIRVGSLQDYDYVVKTRSDVSCNVSQVEILSKLLQADPSGARLAIPGGGNHCGGINDIFAFGVPEAMSYYLSILDKLDEYYDEIGEFHPEQMLRYHLMDKGAQAVFRFPLQITLRGSLYNPYGQEFTQDDSTLFESSLNRRVERYKNKVKYFVEHHPVRVFFRATTKKLKAVKP